MMFARLCQTLKTLRKAEAAVKKYLKKSHSLAKAAKEAGLAIGTNEKTVAQLSSTCTGTMDDDVLIGAFDAKIKLLEQTVRERRHLEDLRLIRDHAQQRLDQARARKAKSEDADKTKLENDEAKWVAKVELAQVNYDQLLVELTKALTFVDEETAVNGPLALLGLELDAFRKNSHKFLGSVQAMLEGLQPGTYVHSPEEALEALKQENESFRAERPPPPLPPGYDE